MEQRRWEIKDDYRKISIDVLQENLASLRARIGINQEDISNVIGISRQSYCAFETRKREMPWHFFLSLIFFFDSVAETHEMIRDLKIFPTDLLLQFNEKDAPEKTR